MGTFLVNGKKVLKGCVNIGGAKNSAVAILPAALLADTPCIIENVPNINDVKILTKIICNMGAVIKQLDTNTLFIDPSNLTCSSVPHEASKQMRASYYLLGAMLGKLKKSAVAMPGGCNFGTRPIDQHIKGFKNLGANIRLEHGMVKVETENLIGGNVCFDVISVGATINLILASVKANGITVLENAAKEPHVVDVANFLNSLGADIRGAGTDTIRIKGVKTLIGRSYSIIPDQIEAGTFMLCAMATMGDITIKNIIPKHLCAITEKMIDIGATITEYDDAMRVQMLKHPKCSNIKTMPYPGFPTDMQPQTVALLSIANGTSIVTEGVWENRFKYVDELASLGAKLQVSNRTVVIEGIPQLNAAPIKATDLRAGAALLIAALAADGVTEIENIHHIERGYDNIMDKLKSIGADISLL